MAHTMLFHPVSGEGPMREGEGGGGGTCEGGTNEGGGGTRDGGGKKGML